MYFPRYNAIQFIKITVYVSLDMSLFYVLVQTFWPKARYIHTSSLILGRRAQSVSVLGTDHKPGVVTEQLVYFPWVCFTTTS